MPLGLGGEDILPTSWLDARGGALPNLGHALPSAAGVHRARQDPYGMANATTKRVLLLCSVLFTAACGNSWIGQTSEAREQPRLETVDVAGVPAGALTLPNEDRSIKFAVIGDSGRGWKPQHEVAAQMAAYRQRFDFKFVLMAGDNIYEGPATPEDYRLKFEEPYKALLDAGVRFYAVLGNHDDPKQVDYEPFNMNGDRYYTFAKKNVRFFAFDTNLLDQAQLAWIDKQLEDAREDWKVCFFHHPLYSHAGRHGGNIALRVALEPILLKHGVDVVFAGHDHVYERVKPQKGITYFVSGSAGQLRRGDMRPSDATAASFDQDLTFMLVDVDRDDMRFQAKSRTGAVVDSGTIRRRVRE
jgi:3',5'-cyclic AMP phosphodiesterase CpdA